MDKKFMGIAIASNVVAVLSTTLQAQQDSIEEIFVTASRTEKSLNTIPNTVTVINSEELVRQIAISNDMSAIIGNLVPSFSPSRQKLTGSGESLRGRSPMYMVDGVPQSNPLRDGARDGHTIDPLMLERIEIIHGANAIHGLGASGGIINMITRQPGDDVQQSLRLDSVVQDADINESFGYGATYNFSGRLSEQFDLLASLRYRESGVGIDGNGDVVGFDNTQGDTMDATTLNGFVKLGYNWNDQRLELTLNHYDIEGNNDWLTVNGDVAAGMPTTAVEDDVPGDAPANEVTMLSVNYTDEDIFGHSLHIHAFNQEFTATYGGGIFGTFQDPRFGSDLFDQSANNSDKQGVKITLVKDGLASLPVSLVYGIDFFSDETFQELVQTGRKWVPATDYLNYAPFAQAEINPVQGLILTAGIRHEESTLEVNDFTTLASYNGGQFVQGGEPDFSATLYNAGATYAINDTLRVFGNYSESFSMPDVGRVLRGINEPGQTVESFLDLRPILTDNAEVGLEYDNDSFNAQLSYYTSESDFGQRLQPDSDGIFSVRREQTEIDGIELRGEWQVAADDVLAMRYAYTEGEFDSDGDGNVDTDLDGRNISPNRINLSWDRSWSITLSSRLQVNHLFDREFENSSGLVTSEFEGYTTVDASADVQVLDGTLSISVQNLFDEQYFTYYAQTVGGDNRFFSGFGRSISLVYNLTF